MGIESVATFAQQRRDRKAQPRQKRVKPVKGKATSPIMTPTPERMAMGGAVLDDVHNYEEATRREVWVIKSWHAMMHARGKLTDDQFKTLQKYCDQWDIANRSPLKSNLDRSIGSGEGGASYAYLDAQKNLRHWNSSIGRQAASELELVCCKALGYDGAARSLFGDRATSTDSRRIKQVFFKTLNQLEYYMR